MLNILSSLPVVVAGKVVVENMDVMVVVLVVVVTLNWFYFSN